MNPTERPAISEPIKRSVRQRCGFGCVICGLPIYDYDHIVEFSVKPEHEENNLTLLCPSHHREKTSGLLPVSEVIAANDAPFNIRAGYSPPFKLNYKGAEFHVRMGKTHFSVEHLNAQDYLIPLIIDGHPMIALHYMDDQLLLDLWLYNNENKPILIIKQNELVFSAENWDITFIGRRLQIRLASRSILMVIHFNPPGEVWIEHGSFLLNGVRFDVEPTTFRCGHCTLSVHNVYARIGIVIGHTVNHPRLITQGCAIRFEAIDRYKDAKPPSTPKVEIV